MLSRSTIKLFLWMLPLLLLTWACRAATDLAAPETSPPTPLSLTSISPTETTAFTSMNEVEASCQITLHDIIDTANDPGGIYEADKEWHLVTYQVTGDEISEPVFKAVPIDLKEEQEDSLTQQKVWDYFAALVPEEHRAMVSEFSVLTDGTNNILAAVSQTQEDPTKWTLEVDIADSADTSKLTFTLLHEYGHLLTLNADQVPPDLAVFNNPGDPTVFNHEVSLCPNYFTGEGCSNADSYINRFHLRFWSGIIGEWNAIDQIDNEKLYLEKMTEFQNKYQDQFVNEYAARNPVEDIAETWVYFLLTPKPDGNSIANQKVLSFYEYPELIEIRSQILERLCTIFPE